MNKEFQVHILNDAGKAKARQIAEAFDTLLEAIASPPFVMEGNAPPICPPGRELAIVKTKLEEACFFAKKAMASDPANVEP